MSLKEDVEKLVARIVRKASDDGTDLQDATEALKIVTAYLVAEHKFAKERSDDDEEGSFHSFKRDLEESQDASVRGRARRRPS